MSHEHFVPVFEPYKAATTLPPGFRAPLPPGARRTSLCVESPHSHFGRDSPFVRASKLLPCYGIIVREQPHHIKSSCGHPTPDTRLPKPTATVVPTAVTSIPLSPIPSAALCSSCNRHRSSTTDVTCQTDDIGIDMDLLLHIEDMIRTQRSLTLPRYTLEDEQANQCDGVPLCQKVKELQEALLVQGNVNNDLKRLLVSALAGNSDLAYKLVDLTSDNVNLAGKSEHLAAQKAALAEMADTAGIAADVWRAKCLAGRVVATEAARRLAVANRQVQLTKHALAHLLGERARLRRDLGQTASSLLLLRSLQSSAINSDSCHHVAHDTLELASLCHQLASACLPVTKMETPFHPIVCQTDSPGERLALQILMNDFPDGLQLEQPSCPPTTDGSQDVPEQSQVDLSTLVPVPPSPNSEDLIEKAIQSFSSSRLLGPATLDMSACRGCNGRLTAI